MTAHPYPSGPDGLDAHMEIPRYSELIRTPGSGVTSPDHPQCPIVRLHVWLEHEGELFFGIGRAQILYNIQRYGSITKAARSMGMSYRAAWGKIQQSERALGVKLVEQRGARREGVRLTREGEELADMFQAWFMAVERCALSQANSIFPFPVAGFDQPDT